MDKKEIINRLRAAKSAHIKWRTYAQAILSGLEIDDDKVPVLHTDCAFGKWYYGSGQRLSTLHSYKAIEQPHEIMHTLYMKLFKHLFEEEDIGLFKKLIGSAKRRQEHDAIGEKYMKDIIEMSKALLEAIEVLETEILNMNEVEIAELV